MTKKTEKGKTGSLAKQTSALFVAMLFVSILSIALFSFFIYQKDITTAYANRASSIAQTVAAAVDPDAFVADFETGQETEHWQSVKKYADEVKRSTDMAYLYIVSGDYSKGVHYYLEGYDPVKNADEEEYDFGYIEPVDYFGDEMFAAIDTGKPTISKAYYSEGYGRLVSGFAPIVNSQGKTVGAVGVDIRIDDVNVNLKKFGLTMLVANLLFTAAFGLLIRYLINRFVGKPLDTISQAAKQIAQGNMGVDIHIQSKEEIGSLADAFRQMISSARKEEETLIALANGDFSMQVTPRGEYDNTSIAMNTMIDNLNSIFRDIREGSAQLSAASSQIADGSQALAQGATEQAETIERLADSIAGVAEKATENTHLAGEASRLAAQIESNAEIGNVQMKDMVSAVNEISNSNTSISQVIKAIDDIAFQTNILALNAAVEAARAGVHGKGFAVVADEVRTLAAKSAESAKSTAALIENSMQKTQLGVELADKTAASLQHIVEGIQQSSAIIENISAASQLQNAAVAEIHSSIDDVAHVVQQNSATAEESAAASQEMNSQSHMLDSIASRYKLKNNVNTPLLTQAQSPALPYNSMPEHTSRPGDILF